MMKKNKNKLLAIALVSAQYGLLALFLISGSWFSSNIIGFSIQLAGILLAFWAIWEMRRSRLNIAPCVRKGSRLVKSGPYSIMRHPMYLSIILASAPLLFEDPSLMRVLIFILLIPSLFLKLNFEEQRLLEHFGLPYALYINKTWKFIPMIY